MRFYLLLPFVALVATQDIDLNTVKQAFDAADIPADLSISFNPTALLEVTLPQTTGPPVTLHAGIQLPRNSTAGPPVFRVVGNVGPGPFVAAAVDPDAATVAQIRHLLASNFFTVAPRAPVQHLVNRTAAISAYRQPTPPAGSPAHRYIFLLYKQPANFDEQTLVTPTTPIQLFNISSFASATGLGAPIAGTYMLVAPDSTPA